jgi:hypothetical protein
VEFAGSAPPEVEYHPSWGLPQHPLADAPSRIPLSGTTGGIEPRVGLDLRRCASSPSSDFLRSPRRDAGAPQGRERGVGGHARTSGNACRRRRGKRGPRDGFGRTAPRPPHPRTPARTAPPPAPGIASSAPDSAASDSDGPYRRCGETPPSPSRSPRWASRLPCRGPSRAGNRRRARAGAGGSSTGRRGGGNCHDEFLGPLPGPDVVKSEPSAVQ